MSKKLSIFKFYFLDKKLKLPEERGNESDFTAWFGDMVDTNQSVKGHDLRDAANKIFKGQGWKIYDKNHDLVIVDMHKTKTPHKSHQCGFDYVVKNPVPYEVYKIDFAGTKKLTNWPGPWYFAVKEFPRD